MKIKKRKREVRLLDNKGKVVSRLPGSTTIEELVKRGLRPEYFKIVPEGTPLPDGWCIAKL